MPFTPGDYDLVPRGSRLWCLGYEGIETGERPFIYDNWEF
jgi:hypothetical protein